MNNAFFSDLLTSISERGRTLLRRAGSSDTKQTASDLIELCEALLSGRGEASATAMAREVLDRYHDLDAAHRISFFETLARGYGPDQEKLQQAIDTWRAAIHGDAPSAIRLALRMEHPSQITARTDLTMTVLLNCALNGSAGAALVLSHALRQMPLDGVLKRRLATSWLANNLRLALPGLDRLGVARRRHRPAEPRGDMKEPL